MDAQSLAAGVENISDIHFQSAVATGKAGQWEGIGLVGYGGYLRWDVPASVRGS